MEPGIEAEPRSSYTLVRSNRISQVRTEHPDWTD